MPFNATTPFKILFSSTETSGWLLASCAARCMDPGLASARSHEPFTGVVSTVATSPPVPSFSESSYPDPRRSSRQPSMIFRHSSGGARPSSVIFVRVTPRGPFALGPLCRLSAARASRSAATSCTATVWSPGADDAPAWVQNRMTRFMRCAARTSSLTASTAHRSHCPMTASPPDARLAVLVAPWSSFLKPIRRCFRWNSLGTQKPQSSQTDPEVALHRSHMASSESTLRTYDSPPAIAVEQTAHRGAWVFR